MRKEKGSKIISDKEVRENKTHVENADFVQRFRATVAEWKEEVKVYDKDVKFALKHIANQHPSYIDTNIIGLGHAKYLLSKKEELQRIINESENLLSWIKGKRKK